MTNAQKLKEIIDKMDDIMSIAHSRNTFDDYAKKLNDEHTRLMELFSKLNKYTNLENRDEEYNEDNFK